MGKFREHQSTPGSRVSKTQENMMVMQCVPGREGNLIQASNFPFHNYFPVRQAEPFKPSLINGSVYIRHTFSKVPCPGKQA